VTKHYYATTWHHRDQLLVGGFWNISLIYLAFVTLGIYRFIIWYGNSNNRKLIGKENYIHNHFDAHCAFCDARSLTSFGCPYYVSFSAAHKSEYGSSPVMIFAKNRLWYWGNCFNQSGTYLSYF
jgi:hypothetical protein